MEHAGRLVDDVAIKRRMGGGIGTPATRADIIEKLIQNHYIERSGKELVPTAKGRELVRLVPEELRSVEQYLLLEQARFGDRLQVKLRVDQEVLSVRITFLCIQPLVENAVRHGLEDRDSPGTVSITAVERGGDRASPVETEMVVEAVIFSGDQGVDDLWRNLGESHPLPVGLLELGKFPAIRRDDLSRLLRRRLADVADTWRERDED